MVEDTFARQSSGTIIFCQHPAVVTLGRSTQPGDVTDWTGPLLEITRGGRATYHGPSQLMVYPIINLKYAGQKRLANDVGSYLRALEDSIVNTLKKYGVESQGRSLQRKSASDSATDETGVWVNHQKIASLGIAVRKWISFHGAAINLFDDPTAFQGLKPCGFQPSVMTNLEAQIEGKIDIESFKSSLFNELIKHL